MKNMLIWILVITFFAVSLNIRSDLGNCRPYYQSVYLGDNTSSDSHIEAKGRTLSIIKSFDAPGNDPEGLAWDGVFLWCGEWDSRQIYKIYPVTGKVINSFDVLKYGDIGGPAGLAWDGRHLWSGSRPWAAIHQIDSRNGKQINSFSYPAEGGPGGLAWDGKYLWSGNANSNTIDKIDTSTGRIIKSLKAPQPLYFVTGLAWDGKYLWCCGSEEIVYEKAIRNKIFKINPENGEIITYFYSPTPATIRIVPHGLAWDGNYLWYVEKKVGLGNEESWGKIYKLKIPNGVSNSKDITSPIHNYPLYIGFGIIILLISLHIVNYRLNLIEYMKKKPQSCPYIIAIISGLIGIVIATFLIVFQLRGTSIILNVVAFLVVIGALVGMIIGLYVDSIKGTDKWVYINIVVGVISVIIINDYIFGDSLADWLDWLNPNDQTSWFALIILFIFIILPSVGGLLVGAPCRGVVSTFFLSALIPEYLNLIPINKSEIFEMPLLIVAIFALAGYGIGKVMVIGRMKLEEKKRNEEEIRRKKEKQKRIKKQQEEINNLIIKTEKIIKSAMRDATNSNNSLWLTVLRLLENDLLNFSQEFENRRISYTHAKARILDLKKKAETLKVPPYKKEKKHQKQSKKEPTLYEILGVASDASQKEIKRYYYKKIKEYHSDKFMNQPEWVKKHADNMSKKINEAYEILSDINKRREYDNRLKDKSEQV